jgi:hypothetical protein
MITVLGMGVPPRLSPPSLPACARTLGNLQSWKTSYAGHKAGHANDAATNRIGRLKLMGCRARNSVIPEPPLLSPGGEIEPDKRCSHMRQCKRCKHYSHMPNSYQVLIVITLLSIADVYIICTALFW